MFFLVDSPLPPPPPAFSMDCLLKKITFFAASLSTVKCHEALELTGKGIYNYCNITNGHGHGSISAK